MPYESIVVCYEFIVVFASRKKAKTKHDTERYYGRAYGKMDQTKFILDVMTTDWDDVYTAPDPELSWTTFKTKFVSILDKHAPYKYFNSRLDRQPWVTTEHLERANERDEKANISATLLTPDAKLDFKRTRNRVTPLKREFKRMFFETSI